MTNQKFEYFIRFLLGLPAVDVTGRAVDANDTYVCYYRDELSTQMVCLAPIYIVLDMDELSTPIIVLDELSTQMT